ISVLLEWSASIRALHTFPTRRSSDLHGPPVLRQSDVAGVVRGQPATGPMRDSLKRRLSDPEPRLQQHSDHAAQLIGRPPPPSCRDRKSTRLNSSHDQTSYAAFCLKKK